MLLISTAGLLLGLGFVLYLQFAAEFERKLQEKEESFRIENVAGVFTDILDDIVGDLLFLSQSENLQRYLLSRKPLLDWTYLAKEMVSYAKAEQVYDRIQFIDETGKELIRIDFNGGDPAIIPRSQLQGSPQLDYVKESSQLDKGDVHISRLGLATENGTVLLPHKPLLRIATPVYDGRYRKRGVLVLSYSAATLFERIGNTIEHSLGEVMLLDYQGYWLMGGAPEKRWAFMFHLEHSLALQRPALWRQIQQGISGSPRVDGWSYLYRNIRLAQVNSPTVTSISVANRLTGLGEWTVLVALPPKPLFDWRNEDFLESLILFLILLGTVAIASFIAAQLWVRTRQQKEAEKLASSVISTVSDAIMVTDGENRIMAVNPAFSRITGYSAEEVMGRNPSLLRSERQDTEFYQRMWDGLKQEGNWEGELWSRRKDGSLYPERLSIVSVAHSRGEVQRHVGVFHDISERKQIEDALKQARNTAEAAANAKSLFLANMGHEMRTPLNAILGVTYLLKRDGLSSGQTKQVDRIDAAGRHLLGLINNILDLTKLDSQGVVLEQTDIDLAVITQDVASRIREQISNKGLQLLVEAPPMSAALIGDPKRLTQALLNLSVNAVKFTDKGSITLMVELMEENSDSALLRFAVADTGIGIDPSVQTQLFTAFEQVDGSSTRLYGGAGLGLSIVKRLAERMGGEAGVESRLGQGSTFWFTARLDKNSLQQHSMRSSEALNNTLERPEMQYAASHTSETINDFLHHQLMSLEDLDLKQGLNAINNDPTSYFQLLLQLSEDHSDAGHRFSEYVRKGEYGEVRRLAHTLGGASRTLGLRKLTTLAEELEMAVHGRKSKEELVPMIGLLAKRLESLSQTMNQLSQDTPVPPSADSGGDRIPELLQHLEALLEMDDTAVNKVSLEHETLLFQALGKNALKLKNEIESYDYESALTTVRECIESRSSNAG